MVTMEAITKKFNISKPEAKLHLTRLWEKCYISDVGDGLDDPPGCRINPDGSAYILALRQA
jgi:hypothetical protein